GPARDPGVVPDQYTLGERDVGQVLGGDLVEHAEDDGGRVGPDVGHRRTPGHDRWLAEDDAPSGDACRERAREGNPPPVPECRRLHVGAIGEVPDRRRRRAHATTYRAWLPCARLGLRTGPRGWPGRRS